MVDYITKVSIIIFSPKFNNKLDYKLLSNYKQIIFGNYELNNSLFNAYANNDFNDLKYIGSCYDQKVNLHQNITHGNFW